MFAHAESLIFTWEFIYSDYIVYRLGCRQTTVAIQYPSLEDEETSYSWIQVLQELHFVAGSVKGVEL